MILSSGNTPVARATTAIEATRNQSTVITPTVAYTANTSIVTWVHTFTAGTGATATPSAILIDNQQETTTGGNPAQFIQFRNL